MMNKRTQTTRSVRIRSFEQASAKTKKKEELIWVIAKACCILTSVFSISPLAAV